MSRVHTIVPTDTTSQLVADYENAVIHISWNYDSATRSRNLIFAWVELLPHEIPPPIDDFEDRSPAHSLRLGHESTHRVFVRHLPTRITDALAWYRDCVSGVVRLPYDVKDTHRPELRAGPFLEEPRWPRLLFNTDDTDSLPFRPAWISSPRTHHLLNEEATSNFTWSSEETERAYDWLESSFHFAFRNYVEYLGSIHLVAPNPVYRGYSHSRSAVEPDDNDRYLTVRLERRAMNPADPVELLLSEGDKQAVRSFIKYEMRDSEVTFVFPDPVRAIKLDIWDPRRGFLTMAGEHRGFFKLGAVNLRTMHSKTYTVRGTTHTVSRYDPSFAPVVQRRSEPVVNAQQVLSLARMKRRRRRLGAEFAQQWFFKDKETARSVLAKVLARASLDVLFVDAYFAVEELPLAFGVEHLSPTIRILTSAETLRNKRTSDGRKKGLHFAEALAELRTHAAMNTLDVRVMLGDKPPVHDRFLLVDEEIWSLGSSLNEFGSRGTVMMRLPDPNPILVEIERQWTAAESLEKWLLRPHDQASEAPPSEHDANTEDDSEQALQ